LFLELRSIHFRYPGANADILRDFHLQVEKGEILSLIGLSGSGKSTVLRLIAGLEIPLSGSISINERVVASSQLFIPPEKRNIGMVFQDFALFPHLTVVQNIGFGLSKLPGRQRRERVGNLLSLIHMEDYQGRFPYQLSGGQQQRVALARALAPNPYLLLMDEPFSNIDSELRGKLRQEVRAILKAENATCIFVTHDQSDVVDMCDRSIPIAPPA
jgi:iron(III) transport system ATP-binding protein